MRNKRHCHINLSPFLPAAPNHWNNNESEAWLSQTNYRATLRHGNALLTKLDDQNIINLRWPN